jgi:hypothetical protein
MNKENENPKFAYLTPTVVYSLVAALLLVGNLYIYQFVPFEGLLNDAVQNAIFVLAAFMAAATATAIFLHYQPEDQPRKIWLYVMLASWSWCLAELIWSIMAYAMVEVPAPSIPDIGWVAGNVFFAVAFYYQYAVIFPNHKKRIVNIIYVVWAVALLVPLVALLVTHIFSAEAYINYHYPIADLALGIAGVSLIFVFRGGALMRPWVGLFFFAVSDLVYAWAVQAGLYEWSVQNSNVLTTAIDSIYLVAYFVFGIGLIGQWALLNYGLPDNH